MSENFEILYSLGTNDAKNKAVVQNSLNSVSKTLKKMDINWDTTKIQNNISQVNSVLDATTGKVKELNFLLKLSSGRYATINQKVEYTKQVRDKETGEMTTVQRNNPKITTTGFTEANNPRLIAKNLERMYKYKFNAEEKFDRLQNKGLENLTKNEKIAMDKYYNSKLSWERQIEAERKNLINANLNKGETDSFFKKVEHMASDSDIKKGQDADRQALAATKEKSRADTQAAREYEKNEKSILAQKRVLWGEQAKADASSYNNTKQSKHVQAIANAEIAKGENLAKEMRKVAKDNPELTGRMNQIKQDYLDKAEQALAVSKAQYAVNQNIFKDMMSGWKDATARIINYTVIYRSLWGLIQGFQAGVQTIVELNKAFTDIQMVTGYTNAETQALSKQYGELAVQMGATTSQVAEGATAWLRQGKSVGETNKLIEQSMILSKVGAMSSAEATEYLTSTLNGYKMEVEDATRVVDVFSKLDMSAATSSKELAIAFSRTANSAHDAGMGFEELAGYITTVSETTRRSASTVGESFKTIFARYQNVKVGKVIDDESGEAINDTEKALGTLGIRLRKTETEWRDASDVLKEVGSQWGTYDELQKNTIVTSLAGTRQAEMLRSAFNNFNKVMDYTAIAYDSAGSSAEKYAIYMDSIEAKQNKLISTFQQIAYQPVFEQMYKAALNLGAGLGDILNTVMSFKGTMPLMGAAIMLATGPNAIKGIVLAGSKLQAYAITMGKLSKLNNTANVSIRAYIRAMQGASVADSISALSKSKLTAKELNLVLARKISDATVRQDTVNTIINARAKDAATLSTVKWTTALKGLWLTLMTNPLFWIGVAILSIFVLAKAWDKFNVTMEEQAKIVEELTTKVSDLQSEYDSLLSKETLTNKEKTRLAILEAELAVQNKLLAIEEKKQSQIILDKYTKAKGGSMGGYENTVGGAGAVAKNKTELDKEIASIDDYKKKKEQILKLEQDIALKQSQGFTVTEDVIKQLDTLYETTAKSEEGFLTLYENLMLIQDASPEIAKVRDELAYMLGIVQEIAPEFKASSEEVAVFTTKYKGATQEVIKAAVERTKAEMLEVQKRISGYQLELDALNKVISAQQTSDGAEGQRSEQMWVRKNAALLALQEDLTSADAEYTAVSALIAGLSGGYVPEDDDGKGGSDSAIEAQNLTDALIRAYRAQAELDKLQGTSLEKQIKTADKAGDYALAMELTEKYLENQLQTIKDLRSAQDKIHEEANRLRAESNWGKMSDGWFDINNEMTPEYQKLLDTYAGKTDKASHAAKKSIEALFESLYKLKQGYKDIGNEIDGFAQKIQDVEQEAKDRLVDAVQKKIDKIQWQIDDINYKMANDPRIKALNTLIEKKKKELEQQKESAESEKTKTDEIQKQKDLINSLTRQKDIRVYRADKGWTWEADQSKISEEKAKLKDLELEYANWKLEKEIQDLEDSLTSITDSYQKQIDALQLKLDNDTYLLNKATRNTTDSFKTLYDNLSAFNTSSDTMFEDLMRWVEEIIATLGMEVPVIAGKSTDYSVGSKAGVEQVAKMKVGEKWTAPDGSIWTKTETGVDVLSKGGTATENAYVGGKDTGGYSGTTKASDSTNAYSIVSDKGKSIANSLSVGGTYKASDGSTWTKTATGINVVTAKGTTTTGIKVNDEGGLNTGKGFMAKNIVEPERVLSPNQTKSFEQLVGFLPKLQPLFSSFGLGNLVKTNNNTVGGTDNSVTIEQLTINAPNGATFSSLMQEAKNLSKINKK